MQNMNYTIPFQCFFLLQFFKMLNVYVDFQFLTATKLILSYIRTHQSQSRFCFFFSSCFYGYVLFPVISLFKINVHSINYVQVAYYSTYGDETEVREGVEMFCHPFTFLKFNMKTVKLMT